MGHLRNLELLEKSVGCQTHLHFLRFKYLRNETDLVNLFALGLYHINSVNNHFIMELQISVHLKAKNCCLVAKSRPTLLQAPGLWPARLLCPWDFPSKNTGVGCHSLLQGFPTQGWNSSLLHWQVDSLPLSHQGSPQRQRIHTVFSCCELYFSKILNIISTVYKFTFVTFIL